MQPKITQAMLVDQIFHPTNTSTIIPCLMVSRIRDPNPVQWRSPGNSISPFISPCFLFWSEDSLHRKSLKLWDINPLNLLPFQKGCFGTVQLGPQQKDGPSSELSPWLTLLIHHSLSRPQDLLSATFDSKKPSSNNYQKNTFRNFCLPIIIIIWFVIIFTPIICCIYRYRMHAVSIVCLVFTHLRRLHILAEATRLIVFQHTWSLISTRLADIQQTS